MNKTIERRWAPFIPTIRAFALFAAGPDSHANSKGHQALAAWLRVDRNTISNWVNGNYAPNEVLMARIDNAAKSYGFDPRSVK